MEIHQLLVGAGPGDAITNAAFALRDVLRQVCPSEVYARFYDAALDGEVKSLRSLRQRQVEHPEDNILIFHASIGEPEVFNFIRERPERLVVVHHNISPAAPFRQYDPSFAGKLEGGRQELAALARRCVLALADSHYNALDLESLGYRNVRVAPLITNLRRLVGVTPHEPTMNHIERHVHGAVALFVGQLLPHKRPDFLLQAYHALTTAVDPDVWLVVVGPSRLPAYTASLHAFARELHLPRAWLTGRVSDEELAAFYRRADVFVTASEHEGFCVPLLEAMAFDVPVIARGFAAVPETLGGAGVLLPPGDGPLLAAEAIGEVLHNGALRSSLVDAGRERVAAYDPEHAKAAALQHLLDVA